ATRKANPAPGGNMPAAVSQEKTLFLSGFAGKSGIHLESSARRLLQTIRLLTLFRLSRDSGDLILRRLESIPPRPRLKPAGPPAGFVLLRTTSMRACRVAVAKAPAAAARVYPFVGGLDWLSVPRSFLHRACPRAGVGQESSERPRRDRTHKSPP